MSTYVLAYLNSVCRLSPSLNNAIAARIRTIKVPRKELMLQEGDVSDYIYFIEKGFMRCYYTNKGKETTVWFMAENDIVISVKSFYARTPSYENIETEEECLLHYVSYDQLQQLYADFPEFNLIGRLLTVHYYMLSEERLYNIRNLLAEERYAFLRARHPEICNRAKMGDIASYLGINIATLSRIRSKEAGQKP